MTTPELSIVVAIAPTAPDPTATLASVAAATQGRRIEVLLVGASGATMPEGSTPLPIRHLESAPESLVPVRWGEGIVAATAPIVACLSSEFTVSPGWAGTLAERLVGPCVGAATAITLAPRASAATTAMYLLRFGAFLPQGGADGAVRNIPGDGALYRRADILAHPALLAEGFWEIEFHQRWLAAGLTLHLDPSPQLQFHGPAPLHDGMLLRFRHGRGYGAAMVLRHNHSSMRHILGAPLLPALLIGRIARRVHAAGGSVGMVGRAFLPLLALTGAWAAGEATGAASPGRGAS